MTMDGLTNNLRIRELNSKQPASASEKPRFQTGFQKVFEGAMQRQEAVHFSKHANMRLDARQITLTGEQLSRVEAGLNKADAKGIRDSLVLVDDVALVVNVKSKTVITALGTGTPSGNESVFSNIDGAVIV